jgi:hypothetical protein
VTSATFAELRLLRIHPCFEDSTHALHVLSERHSWAQTAGYWLEKLEMLASPELEVIE